MKIKDFYLSLLSENNNFFYVDNQIIKRVIDIIINKKEDYIQIDFETTYDKSASLVTKYSEFKKWYTNNNDTHEDAFKSFVEEYIAHSKETEQVEQVFNEIVDDEGNIMASTDKPNNATNTMVGANNVWDLEKLFKSSIPKSTKFYSGALGIGTVTW